MNSERTNLEFQRFLKRQKKERAYKRTYKKFLDSFTLQELISQTNEEICQIRHLIKGVIKTLNHFYDEYKDQEHILRPLLTKFLVRARTSHTHQIIVNLQTLPYLPEHKEFLQNDLLNS